MREKSVSMSLHNTEMTGTNLIRWSYETLKDGMKLWSRLEEIFIILIHLQSFAKNERHYDPTTNLNTSVER